MIPTAMSTTFPRMANSLNSFNMLIISIFKLVFHLRKLVLYSKNKSVYYKKSRHILCNGFYSIPKYFIVVLHFPNPRLKNRLPDFRCNKHCPNRRFVLLFHHSKLQSNCPTPKFVHLHF
jgi:hypothetical protein